MGSYIDRFAKPCRYTSIENFKVAFVSVDYIIILMNGMLIFILKWIYIYITNEENEYWRQEKRKEKKRRKKTNTVKLCIPFFILHNFICFIIYNFFRIIKIVSCFLWFFQVYTQNLISFVISCNHLYSTVFYMLVDLYLITDFIIFLM